MTIDEAIEIKQRTGDEFLATDPDDIDKAEMLSIEALNRWKFHRGVCPACFMERLPGETKD